MEIICKKVTSSFGIVINDSTFSPIFYYSVLHQDVPGVLVDMTSVMFSFHPLS